MSLTNLGSQIPVLTDIAWNQTAFNKAGSTMHNWSQTDQNLQQKDETMFKDKVVEAYSQMKVEEYVDFSKTFTPFMKW